VVDNAAPKIFAAVSRSKVKYTGDGLMAALPSVVSASKAPWRSSGLVSCS